MTAEELDILQTLCDKATPAPWVRKNPSDRGQDYIVGNIKSWSNENYIITCDSGVYGPRPNDADFITAAREAMPKLIAEVRKLRRIVGTLHAIDCAAYVCDSVCGCGFEEVMK